MPTSPRGLATLALIKTRFDEGRDHLALFEPFIADAVLSLPEDHFFTADIQQLVESRHGLIVPTTTIQTLLGRMTQSHHVKREGGHYFRCSTQAPCPDIESERSRHSANQEQFASRFLDYAKRKGFDAGGVEDALASILEFLSENRVSLLLDEPLDVDVPTLTLTLSAKRTIAGFITEVCIRDAGLRTTLSLMLEGLVLGNALLLKDIANLSRRFKGLLVVLDTAILFAMLDLTGIANAIAAKEAIALTKDAGATVVVFDKTVDEMRRILAVYERHLGTVEGQLLLHPTELTRYFLTNKYKPSDVRTISATLETRLSHLGIPCRPTPTRDEKYTLDEKALAKALASSEGETGSPRVWHDIDCVAAVLTLRASRRATAIEDSMAIFASTSRRVIRSIQDWYRAQGEAGVPPIVSQSRVTNLAWLKRPDSPAAAQVKLHELVSLCCAALRPTRRMWAAFLDNLRQLRQDRSIAGDEAVAIIASELTEPLLAEAETDEEPDADTIGQVIERVKASYSAQFETVAQQAIQQANAQAELASQAASAATARLSKFEGTLERWVAGLSRLIANVVAGAIGGLLAIAVLFSFPGALEYVPSSFRLFAWGGLIALGVATLLGVVNGTNLRSLRDRLQGRLSALIQKAFLGD